MRAVDSCVIQQTPRKEEKRRQDDCGGGTLTARVVKRQQMDWDCRLGTTHGGESQRRKHGQQGDASTGGGSAERGAGLHRGG